MLDTDGVNAFAAPGGIVHITKGALGLIKNEAELAGVLGHEIAHITKKHTVNAIQKSNKVSRWRPKKSGGGGRRSPGHPARHAAYDNILNNGSAATTRTRRTRRACGWRTRSATPAGSARRLTKLMDRNKDVKENRTACSRRTRR